jgi:drug/metabolite transporter (DMT)-like permease
MRDRQQIPPSDLPTADGAPLRLLDPRLHLGLNVLLVTASELLLKRGAMSTPHAPGSPWLDSLGIATLGSGWVWAGIACYVVSFLNWLYILRWLPLSIAFPLASTVHALIPLGAWLFLGETLGPVRWGGIVLILAGIWFIAEPMMRAEEAL